LGAQTYPKPALDYLNDWADPGRGYLRKFYPAGSDEPHFDLTPPTEKAIAWLETLNQRSFVGTESRLLTLFDLLKQLSEGSETDPAARLAGLQRRRDEIDAEMARVLDGDIPLLDDTAIKDRFQQVTQLARGLLSDFREVEQNFRGLDRKVRERIALWNGAKGDLLGEIMGARDAIADSDQGRSFRAFWDFLMSADRQEEFTALLERILALAPIAELRPDPRLSRVHYDWLEAGELTQRMVAQLSQQLRRFLDDQAWLENRRIMEILHNIEAKALALRDAGLPDIVMQIPEIAASIELPMERRLHAPAAKPAISDMALVTGNTEIDASALYAQFVVDKARLAGNIRQALQSRAQVNLAELCRRQKLRHGLAELVAYLQLAAHDFQALVDDSVTDTVVWERTGPTGVLETMQARIPRVIYLA
jgi:flagellar motility protein MotE (MotC chaperone)